MQTNHFFQAVARAFQTGGETKRMSKVMYVSGLTYCGPGISTCMPSLTRSFSRRIPKAVVGSGLYHGRYIYLKKIFEFGQTTTLKGCLTYSDGGEGSQLFPQVWGARSL